jgi:hypothetical protein
MLGRDRRPTDGILPHQTNRVLQQQKEIFGNVRTLKISKMILFDTIHCTRINRPQEKRQRDPSTTRPTF